MKLFKHPHVKPLAYALALTFGAGISVPVSFAVSPTTQAEHLLFAAKVAATAITSRKAQYVKEERSDHGARTHASRYSPMDENGIARYIVLLKEAPLASYAALPKLQSGARPNRKDVKSGVALSYVAHLQSAQQQFVSNISSKFGRQISAVAQYQHALNGLALDLSVEEADLLRSEPDVLMVNREQVRELKTYNTPILIGADTIWNGTSTPGNVASYGEGMVIGQIDSGINWTSKSMQALGADGYTVTNPLGTGTYLGNCLASTTVNNGYKSNGLDVGHCNAKLIGIYNMEVSNTNVFNVASGQDLDGHGSHTTSTAGGSFVTAAPYAGGSFNLSGIAPHANVIAYLACGTTTNSCLDTGLAAAANQAVADGIVDAINYSIGGPENSPWGDTIQQAFLGAEDAGIFIAVAAGNDGPDPSTINGNEAPWTTTVAATTPAKIPSFTFSLSSVAGNTGIPANTQGLAAVPGSAPAPSQAYNNLPLIQSPNFANGSNDGCAAYPANTFSRGGVGAIAVLRLDQNASNCASGTRRAAAATAGATAVIFVDPEFISLGATGASYSVLLSAWNNILATPGIDVTPAGNATASLGFPISTGPRTPDLMAGFSSRGPIAFNMLKPDISGPGDNILAALSPTATSGYSTANQAASSVLYGVESGTSMATPHITGSAILIRAIQPTWTPMQVKSAMMTTAKTVLTEDGSATADANSAGAGRIDLSAATRASLLFDETTAHFTAADPAQNGKPENLNIASYYNFNCTGICAFPRTVSSALASAGTWDIAVTGLPAGSYTLDHTSLSLAAGAQASYTLSIDSSLLPLGQWTYGQLTLTSSDSTLPVQHLPIAIRPATAILHSDTSALTARAVVGGSVSKVVTVLNAGNPTLNWTIPTTTLKGRVIKRAVGDGNGLLDRTVVTAATSTAIQSTTTTDAYGADYFDIWSDGTTLAELQVDGFAYTASTAAYPALNTVATQLAFRVWADNAGQPNGRPGNTIAGDVNPVYQFPAAAGGLGPNAVGVTYPGDAVRVDLTAAGAPVTPLPAGRYWLNAAPSLVGTSTAFYQLLAQDPAKTVSSRYSLPNNATAANKAWRATTLAAVGGATYTGYAMEVVVNAVCSAPWLSYSSAAGTLGLGGSAPVTVTFNATGLTAGTYKAYACLSGNGTSPPNAFTDDTDSILIPVTFTVATPPASPSCTASPNPSNGTSTVTISCTGADVGTTNAIPGTTCTPNPADATGAFTCTGTASTIGSNPTLTSTNTLGDAATVTVALTVDQTAPVAPTCVASPTSAGAATAVTVTCSGVESGTTNSFPTVACTPNPATASGSIACSGLASDFGSNPVLTSTDAVGNATPSAVAFMLLANYTVTATGGSNGTITPPSTTVLSGNTTTFTVMPETGYHATVAGTCGGTLAGNTYTTAVIVADCSVTASFAIDTFGVTASADANGDITPLSQPVNYGATATLSLSAHVGYHIGTVTSNCGGSLSGSEFTTGIVTADCTVAAAFAANTYTVTATSSGNGTITPASQSVTYLGTATFTVLAAAGYNATVTGDTCSVVHGTGDTWTAASIASNCSVLASFSHVVPGFVSLVPSRVLDTRIGFTTSDGLFAGIGAAAAGGQIDLSILGRGGVAANGVTAVVLNVTATNPTAAGFITVWPTGSALPYSSNLNVLPGQTIPNLVIVQLGTGGKVSLYNALGSTDLIADVVGYFNSTSDLTSVGPARLLDTRPNLPTTDGLFAGGGALGLYGKLDLDVAGRAGVPASGAGTVILNVTATNPTASGFITVWPTDLPQPQTSNLNFVAGQTIPNLVITKISAAGKVSLFNSAGTTDVIADVMGWFPVNSQLTSLTPARLLDTRPGTSTIDGQFIGSGALATYGILNLSVTGRGNVPASGVGTVVLNVTATNPTANGYLTVWPTGASQPNASNLNFVPGQTIPNLVIAKVGVNGEVSLFNSAGTTDVIVDVVGWFPDL